MRIRVIPILAIGLLVAACSATAPTSSRSRSSDAPAIADSTAPAAGREIVVYKSPSCSCCHEWEAYMRAQGFTVRSIPTDDMAAMKQQMGMPRDAWSCHTAVVDGYAIEGHVPVKAIEDLLAQRPAIDGIALPGMPAGSPGMPGDKAASFEVLAVVDGDATVFGSY